MREPASGVEGLTPSEVRVAELAAEGLTNREVAQALFVSEKTVETHLGRVYRKLDIKSRHALPARSASAHRPTPPKSPPSRASSAAVTASATSARVRSDSGARPTRAARGRRRRAGRGRRS